MFNNLDLIKKYGSWIKVQVVFYDFLFSTISALNPYDFNQIVINANLEAGNFHDGHTFYESMISKVQERWPTFEDAWSEFLLTNELL